MSVSHQGAELVHRLLRLGLDQRAWVPFLPDTHSPQRGSLRLASEAETTPGFYQYVYRPMDLFVLVGLLRALAAGLDGPEAAYYVLD
ncbi:MAG: hypothetical protein EOO40_08335 [Deltaproteobacteria bacterium]|nr:MAG: hypothetical protein EOO40_08335 [Deltaproteobacteria bacterium]